VGSIDKKGFEKIEAKGPYINFFIDKKELSEKIISQVLKDKERYGSSNIGKNKKIIIEMSSPNIAKPFGIGHLRSTIIGNSISNISSFLGYKTIKINYLGDWGTPFGKIILGYEKFGSEAKLKKDPIKHLLEIYVKVSSNENLDAAAREVFGKLEKGDKKYLALWKRFKDISLKDFDKIYKRLGIKFDQISQESKYNSQLDSIISLLEKKKLLKSSEGAKIVDLEKYNLGVALIKKSDNSTLYATRDLAAAISRNKKYNFEKMFYEVGSEQKLHFKQLFKILELLGYNWAKDCKHIDHGLYLDKDGKKFSTRKGKTISMSDILDETQKLAEKEIIKREKLSKRELSKRAEAITLAAIFYGDLKNFRSNNIIFDIQRFLSFEGNTGPYLLYSYARAKSILKKAKYNQKKKYDLEELSSEEINLISKISTFNKVVISADNNSAPNKIANYAYELSQNFNEFYQKNRVIGSDKEQFRLNLVSIFSQTLKNALFLLGIPILEKM